MSDVEVMPGATTALRARIAEMEAALRVIHAAALDALVPLPRVDAALASAQLVAERDDLALKLGAEVARSRAAEAEIAAVRAIVGGDPATPVSEVLRAHLVRLERVYGQLAIQDGVREIGAVASDATRLAAIEECIKIVDSYSGRDARDIHEELRALADSVKP